MDFSQEYKQKLIFAKDAAAMVQSGDWLDYGWCNGTAYDFDKEPIFFSKNGFLYAPMNVIPNFFDEHNNPNKQRMYIKIGIKRQ